MKLVYTYAFVSILLESVLSIYLKGIYLPLFSIVSLVIIYPFFNNDNKKYILFASFFGLFYDISMTDTLFLNFFLFFLISIIIIYINELLTNNFLIVTFISFITIVSYRFLTLLILFLVSFSPFEVEILLNSITNSLFTNLIYALLSYLLLDYISKKFKIKKID